VFAHHKEEDDIYPLTTIEIAEAQHKDRELKVYFKKNAQMPQKDICFHLIEDTKVLCKNGKLIIPAYLRSIISKTQNSTKGCMFYLIEDTKVLCKNGKIIIAASLRCRAVSWYHHYNQYPGHLCLEEMMRSVMYWKGMGTTIRRYIKTCRYCQVNKRHSQKYGHLPPKLVITTPWKALCVDLIGPFTLKGQEGSSIDFMCLTMINPATS
jgi:hypothetical protein